MTKGTVNAHDVVGHLRDAIDADRRNFIPVIYGRRTTPTAGCNAAAASTG